MSDLDGLIRALDAEVHQVGDRVSAIVRKTAHDIEATAKELAPVDTGHLRSSIGVDIFREDGALIVAEIGPTADYGPYVEYGTHRAGPQPYMGPSADRHAPLMERAIAQDAGRL